MRVFHLNWRRLRLQLQRYSPPVLVATTLWLVWALLALALRGREVGQFLALLLLGLFVLGGGTLAALWAFHTLRRQRQRDAAQQAQLIWLTQVIQPRRPLPSVGTWTADAEVLVALWLCIRERRPRRILELGSGISTLIMAYALEANGQGELWSLEDGAQYAEVVRRQLDDHGLGERATLLTAPLRPWQLDGATYQWYDLAALPADLEFDLLLVDGPAGFLGPLARYPALPLLRNRLSDGAFIFLDDYGRQDEAASVRRWLQEFPQLSQETQRTQGGAAILRLGGTSSTGA